MELSETLHLIPSATCLDADGLAMVSNLQESVLLLRNLLHKVYDQYDYILVDSAPGSGALMLSALYAAEELIMPICDKDSVLGVTKIGDIISANNLSVRVHYLLTKHNSCRSLSKELRDYLVSECIELLYHTIIRENETLKQAACNCQSIFEFNPRCNGAADYQSLAAEISGERKGKLRF